MRVVRHTPSTCATAICRISRRTRWIAWGVLAVSGVLALGLPASAMSLRQLRALELSDPEQGETYADYYLVGVMEGVLEAHNQAVRHGTAPTICPNGRRLEPRMARSLFASQRKRNDGLYEADMPVELVMRDALETTYAC